MFYEVRILDKKGSLKKVISSRSLSVQFWERNNQGMEFVGRSFVDDGDNENYSIVRNNSSYPKMNSPIDVDEWG